MLGCAMATKHYYTQTSSAKVVIMMQVSMCTTVVVHINSHHMLPIEYKCPGSYSTGWLTLFTPTKATYIL